MCILSGVIPKAASVADGRLGELEEADHSCWPQFYWLGGSLDAVEMDVLVRAHLRIHDGERVGGGCGPTLLLPLGPAAACLLMAPIATGAMEAACLAQLVEAAARGAAAGGGAPVQSGHGEAQ